jgi:hypothetical protein
MAAVLACGALFGLGMVAGGGALLAQVPSGWREMHEAWNPAPGVILRSDVKSREVRTGSQPKNYRSSTLYTVVLDCSYQVDGRELTSLAAPAPRQAANDGNLEEAQAVADAYHAGESITVYYDPKDITRTRLDEKGPNGLFWFGLLGGVLLPLCGVGLAWWCWHDWRRGAESPIAT